jgi:hypothetical protein
VNAPTDALGGHRDLSGLARAAGDLAVLLALLITARLEHLQFQLRASEASRWWASNGRDVVNALATGVMTLGLYLVGFKGPIAFLLAASLVVFLTGVQSVLERSRHVGLTSSLLAIAFGLPIVFVPDAVDQLLRRVVHGLFP